MELNEDLNLIPLSKAAKLSRYTPEYLNFLARTGKLKAKKLGRNWYTTTDWLNEMLATPADPGRPMTETKEVLPAEERPIILPSTEHLNFPVLVEVSKAEESKLSESIAKEKLIFLNEKRELRWWNSRFALVGSVLILFFIFEAFSTIKFLRDRQSNESLNFPEAGVVQGEETMQSKVALASENYAVREMKFGGGVTLLAHNYENLSLEISDTRSETAMEKNKDAVKLLIYWKTNKLATSTVEYSKMSGGSPKNFQEDNYGFNHSVVISGLDLATTYIYAIKVRDRWGNEVSSERFSVYTGSKATSIFDLIVSTAEDVFGWAVK